jgi:hypothetical protein
MDAFPPVIGLFLHKTKIYFIAKKSLGSISAPNTSRDPSSAAADEG